MWRTIGAVKSNLSSNLCVFTLQGLHGTMFVVFVISFKRLGLDVIQQFKMMRELVERILEGTLLGPYAAFIFCSILPGTSGWSTMSLYGCSGFMLPVCCTREGSAPCCYS